MKSALFKDKKLLFRDTFEEVIKGYFETLEVCFNIFATLALI